MLHKYIQSIWTQTSGTELEVGHKQKNGFSQQKEGAW